MIVPNIRCGRIVSRAKRNSGSHGSQGSRSLVKTVNSTAVPPRLNATGNPISSSPIAAANIQSETYSISATPPSARLAVRRGRLVEQRLRPGIRRDAGAHVVQRTRMRRAGEERGVLDQLA